MNARRNGTFPSSSAPRTCGDRLEVRAFRQTRPLDCQALPPGAAVVRLPGGTLRIVCAGVRVGPAVVAAVVTQLDTHRRPGSPQ